MCHTLIHLPLHTDPRLLPAPSLLFSNRATPRDTGETRTIAGGVTPGDRADYGSTIFPKSSNVPYVGDQARFMRPEDVVISQDGTTLYVSDRFGQYIHRVTIATREVQAIAGTGVAGFKDSTDADTDGLTAQFHHPRGLALSESGTVLYVADDTNHRIREVCGRPRPEFSRFTFHGASSPPHPSTCLGGPCRLR